MKVAPAISIGFGSCLHQDRQPWTVFDNMLAHHSFDHFFFLGDLIYPDWLDITGTGEEDLTALTEDEHSNLVDFLYRGALADVPLSNFIKQTPVHFMWDDHELFDNYDQGKGTRQYNVSRRAFDQHIAWRNPPPSLPGELYYNLTSDVAGVSVFVIDTRSFRSPIGTLDRERDMKTMLGETQLEQLKLWLRETPNHYFKVIASSSMWNDQVGVADGADAWPVYMRERTALFDFIAAHSLKNVVLVSTDAHWSGVFYFAKYDIYEFSASPLASPAFAPPLFPENVSFSSSIEYLAPRTEGVVGSIIVEGDTGLEFRMLDARQDCAGGQMYRKLLPRIVVPSPVMLLPGAEQLAV